MRAAQQPGIKGSQKWIQRAVNERWSTLERPLLDRIGSANVEWLSPLAADEYAEYRDGSLLKHLGRPDLIPALAEFWPTGGPRWDALGKTDHGDVILVEAKAHIAEMFSSPTGASGDSRKRIEKALDEVAQILHAKPRRAPWTEFFYQIANRLAFLHFLRSHNVPAWLVFVNFLGDREMGGPTTPEEWAAAYQVALHVMGLEKDHAFAPRVIHVYPCTPM